MAINRNIKKVGVIFFIFTILAIAATLIQYIPIWTGIEPNYAVNSILFGAFGGFIIYVITDTFDNDKEDMLVLIKTMLDANAFVLRDLFKDEMKKLSEK